MNNIGAGIRLADAKAVHLKFVDNRAISAVVHDAGNAMYLFGNPMTMRTPLLRQDATAAKAIGMKMRTYNLGDFCSA